MELNIVTMVNGTPLDAFIKKMLDWKTEEELEENSSSLFHLGIQVNTPEIDAALSKLHRDLDRLYDEKLAYSRVIADLVENHGFEYSNAVNRVDELRSGGMTCNDAYEYLTAPEYSVITAPA